jgi:hypothetical protein
MPSRRRGQPLGVTRFRFIRWRPYDTWATELTAGGERVCLETSNNPEKTTRAYDATCWRFGCACEWLNFPEITSRAEAEFLAPPPPLLHTC